MSDLYIFRENSSITYHQFPISPDCSEILDIHDEQYPATVTKWKIDSTSDIEWALLLWTEQISTVCTWEFWGNHKGSELSRSVITTTNLLSNEQVNRFFTENENVINEVDIVVYKLRYYCYWCRNEYPGSYTMRYTKLLRSIKYPDGSIKQPAGNWKYLSPNFYKSESKIL